MPTKSQITKEEREDIETLIKAFDYHGCGFGLDIQAQSALRRLLDALDEANRIIGTHQNNVTS